MQGRLFDLNDREQRLFLLLGLGRLMSVERPLRTLEHELVTQQELPSGGLFLVGGIDRVGGLGLGPCKRQSLGLRNLYTHNFSIIDGLLL